MKAKNTLVFIFALIIFVAGINIYNQTITETVKNCKVIDLQQQQIISGSKNQMSTEIRYLIITDKETFISESSILNGKFNNSDVFFHLEKGKTYNFKVCGVGKSILFDYRNVLNVEK